MISIEKKISFIKAYINLLGDENINNQVNQYLQDILNESFADGYKAGRKSYNDSKRVRRFE